MPSKHCIAFAFKSHKKTAKMPKNCNHHTLHLKTNHKMSVKDFVRQLNMGCNPFQNMDENSKSHVHASNIGYNVKLSFVDVNARSQSLLRSGEQVSNQGGKPSNSNVHKLMGEKPRRSLCVQGWNIICLFIGSKER